MDCPSVSELLPFLLNGTLARDEEDRVRAHLAVCESCRRDLTGARLARSVFSAHIPGKALVNLAWEREMPGLDSALLWQHLGSCEECASDLALLKQSRSLELDSASFQPQALPSRRAFVRYAGLAASILVAFGAGMAYQLSDQRTQIVPLEDERHRLEGRLGELESALERLGEERGSLVARVDELSAPKANVQVLELLPAESKLRGTTGAANEIRLPPDLELVVLVLTTQTDRPATIEVRSSRGVIVWRGDGVRPAPQGGFSLAIPALLLTEADYSILVHSPTRVEAFPFRVKRIP